jgi:hypothetical protein
MFANRVKETTNTTLTGTYTLAGASTGFQTFVSGIGTGKLAAYTCTDGTDWECGIGTVTAGASDTLTRTTILASSNGGSAVNWGSGAKTIFNDLPAEYVQRQVSSKGSNYTILGSDFNRLIRGTTGITLSLTAAATLGNGFHCGIRNDHGSGGVLVISPNGAETIDGKSELVVNTGESFELVCTGSAFYTVGRQSGLLPKGHIFGLTLANDTTDATNDISIAAGECVDDTGEVMMKLTSSLIKRLDADWAVGTNQGGRDNSAVIANDVYHVFLIQRRDTGVTDVFISHNVSPSLPSSYTHKRRIGSIIRASAAIRGFIQNGDEFLLKSPVNLDVNVSNLGTTRTSYTLAGVPDGVAVDALIVYGANISGVYGTVYLMNPDLTAVAAGSGAGVVAVNSAAEGTSYTEGCIRTNTSGQIAAVSSAANTNLFVHTRGWIDTRGHHAA